jgi:phosphoribosylformylglycinamidine cyclo-ligase
VTRSGLSLKDKLPGEDVTLGEALMAPTVIYVKQVTYCPPFHIKELNIVLSRFTNVFSPFLQNQVLEIISKGGIKGIAHITGGGFTDNIPRVFPKGLGAVIHSNSWEVPTVFKWIQEVKCILHVGKM